MCIEFYESQGNQIIWDNLDDNQIILSLQLFKYYKGKTSLFF